MSKQRSQQRRPTTRASSRSTTPTKRRRRKVVDPDALEEALDDAADNEDDAADSGPAQDHALSLFFRRPPAGADHVQVVALTTTGDHVLQDRSAAEAQRNPVGLANLVLESCTRWAATEGRTTKFRMLWLLGDRVLGSHQLACGDGDPTALDGTVESLLTQSQRHNETTQRIAHDGFQMVQEAWRELSQEQRKEIAALRAEVTELRDRLRKAGDVDAEIAISNAAAELEQRARTSEIFETKLLPIVQAMVLRQLQSSQQPLAAPISANDGASSPSPMAQLQQLAELASQVIPNKAAS